ncbi:MAG: hypothetical protein AAFR31_02750 [Cyanobacteria bacterium J06627_8]
MKCPTCNSSETRKNGYRQGRQCYQCKQCGRQFLESYRSWQYSDDVKALCLRMYQNGMGLRSIERATGIHNTTLMHWVREAEAHSTELYNSDDFEKDESG